MRQVYHIFSKIIPQHSQIGLRKSYMEWRMIITYNIKPKNSFSCSFNASGATGSTTL